MADDRQDRPRRRTGQGPVGIRKVASETAQMNIPGMYLRRMKIMDEEFHGIEDAGQHVERPRPGIPPGAHRPPPAVPETPSRRDASNDTAAAGAATDEPVSAPPPPATRERAPRGIHYDNLKEVAHKLKLPRPPTAK